ncbi:hypothetical protein HPB50_023409 [Hyalomma asiaticum]|uniref:Uncharacterized protein n=1 Tax=Hyalomma asiaticum TaxID=266040 RepID=A0ACB7S4X2_HYAAI|nr:hypothetical protein HPB50_023409 [Hyalomma asiaticum]
MTRRRRPGSSGRRSRAAIRPLPPVGRLHAFSVNPWNEAVGLPVSDEADLQPRAGPPLHKRGRFFHAASPCCSRGGSGYRIARAACDRTRPAIFFSAETLFPPPQRKNGENENTLKQSAPLQGPSISRRLRDSQKKTAGSGEAVDL